jgi:hypothetical protein
MGQDQEPSSVEQFQLLFSGRKDKNQPGQRCCQPGTVTKLTRRDYGKEKSQSRQEVASQDNPKVSPKGRSQILQQTEA